MIKSVVISTKECRIDYTAILSSYRRAVENFALGLGVSTSNYELMLAKQGYLLDAARIIEKLSDIYGYKLLYKAAIVFRAAASAYMDDFDRKAHYESLDGRFDLREEVSCFLRSRLRMRACQAYEIWKLYNRDLQYSGDSSASALKFMLDVALELPIDAWDCAPCLAVGGNCKDCGYGRDHKICSHKGSTYEMLNCSSKYMVRSIRSGIAEIKARSKNRQGVDLYSNEPKVSFSGQEADLCTDLEFADFDD